MPAAQALQVPPPPLRAHGPKQTGDGKQRLWRRWRFKTGTARRQITRRSPRCNRRLRWLRRAVPPRRLLQRLRGLLSEHTELYRGLFLLVFCLKGCVGRQRSKPLLSAPRPHPPQQPSHPGPKSRGRSSALNLQRHILYVSKNCTGRARICRREGRGQSTPGIPGSRSARLQVFFQQGELQRRTTVFRQASQGCAQTCISEGTAQSRSAWAGQVSGSMVDGPRIRLRGRPCPPND